MVIDLPAILPTGVTQAHAEHEVVEVRDVLREHDFVVVAAHLLEENKPVFDIFPGKAGHKRVE